jgi:methionyl-tRNA synthetase
VEFLENWTQDGRLQPEVANKVREWFTRDEAGKVSLGDWDISRDAPYFGIRDPRRAGQVLLRLARRADRLPGQPEEPVRQAGRRHRRLPGRPGEVEQIHFIGKDIVTFHTLFWPATLHFSGRKAPDRVYVHGFLTVSGEKMSKSRGTGISPLRYLELGMNAEWLRYYIAAKLNARVEDLDFNPDDFVARVNSRPGGQVHQHRQPRRGLPGQALRRPAVGRRGRRGPHRCWTRLRAHADTIASSTRSANSARRCAR